MNINKYIFLFYITFFLFNNANAFMDKDDKGAQSTGREDLSFLNVKNSNYKKGIDSLNRALKFKKKNKNKKADRKFEKALKYFISSNKEYPNNTEILTHLGYIYNEIGDLMMSEIYYQEGLNIDPTNNLLNQRLGELYFKTKRGNLAQEKLKILSLCNCNEYFILKKIVSNEY